MAAKLSICFLVLFTLIAPWFHGLTHVRHQVAAQAIIYFFFLLILILEFKKKSGEEKKFALQPFDQAALAALCFVLVFSCVSVLPGYSMTTAVRFGSVLAIYAVARLCLSTEKRRFFWSGAAILMAIAYGIYGVLQYYGFVSREYWYTPFSLASRYVNGGHFAALLVYPFFALFLRVLVDKNLFLRMLWLILLTGLSAVLVLTHSRTIWVSLLVGVIVCFFALLHDRPLPRRWLLGGGLGVTGVFIFFAGSGLLNSVTGRFLEIWDGKQLNLYSIMQRFDFWQGAWDAFRSRPWGWGLGTFVHIFPHFKAEADRFTVDYAHNEFIQWGVDTGVVGPLFLGALMLGYIKIVWPALIDRSCEFRKKAELAAYTGTIITWALASQFDFPLRILCNAFIGGILLGAQANLLSEIRSTQNISACRFFMEPLQKTRPLFRKTAILLAVLVGTFITLIQMRAVFAAHQGTICEKNYDWDLALNQYDKAAQWAPWMADYSESAGRLSERRGHISLDSTAKKDWYSRAIHYYEEAIRKHPYWAANYYKKGMLLQMMGEKKTAGVFLSKAVEREPIRDLYIAAYAYWLLEQGETERAVDRFNTLQHLSFRELPALTAEKILSDVYQHEKRIEVLKSLLSNNWRDRYALGRILAQDGRWDEARDLFDASIEAASKEMSPDSFAPHFAAPLAQYYLEHDRRNEACGVWRKAAALGGDLSAYDATRKQICGGDL